MGLIVKEKQGAKYIPLQIPPVEKITADMLMAFAGRDVILEHDDGRQKIYALGNKSIERSLPQGWTTGKVLMDMPSFAEYWRYKLLEYGIDVFTRRENREERIAIMETENATPAQIRDCLESQPHLYGIV